MKLKEPKPSMSKLCLNLFPITSALKAPPQTRPQLFLMLSYHSYLLIKYCCHVYVEKNIVCPDLRKDKEIYFVAHKQLLKTELSFVRGGLLSITMSHLHLSMSVLSFSLAT